MNHKNSIWICSFFILAVMMLISSCQQITLPDATTYTVTYDRNGADPGGSVPVDPNSPYLKDTVVTVLGNINGLSQAGYSFMGWNT